MYKLSSITFHSCVVYITLFLSSPLFISQVLRGDPDLHMPSVSHGAPIGDVANSKRPLLIITKVQLRLRVTRRSATALAGYPQKLAKIVCR